MWIKQKWRKQSKKLPNLGHKEEIISSPDYDPTTIEPLQRTQTASFTNPFRCAYHPQ